MSKRKKRRKDERSKKRSKERSKEKNKKEGGQKKRRRMQSLGEMCHEKQMRESTELNSKFFERFQRKER